MSTTTTPAITGVDFVTIPVRDLDAARAFYGDVLGLEPGKLWQRGDTPALGAEFETGTVTLALANLAGIGREHRPNAAPVALQVADVAAARAALEARGVQFHGETMDTGVCHMAHFADPDGNQLMLHARHAR